MSPTERKKKLQEIKTELSKEQASVAGGTNPENPGRIKELRRTVARILTVQNEKNEKQEVEEKK